MQEWADFYIRHPTFSIQAAFFSSLLREDRYAGHNDYRIRTTSRIAVQ
jgi:hypothetical protein